MTMGSWDGVEGGGDEVADGDPVVVDRQANGVAGLDPVTMSQRAAAADLRLDDWPAPSIVPPRSGTPAESASWGAGSVEVEAAEQSCQGVSSSRR